MRRRLATLGVLLATAAVPSSAAVQGSTFLAPSDGLRTGARAGISPGSGLLGKPDVQLGEDMAAIAASGATWVRLDIDWSAVEPVRGRRDWRDVDRAVAAARQHGLQVLGLLAYSPGWARPEGTTTHAPPRQVGDFARFAAAAAGRLGDKVAAWEIWNEPNISDFWEPGPDPAGYARLLRAASAELRTADPGAVILTGGLAPAETDHRRMAPAEFLAAVYRQGVHGTFDAVAVHPYSYPALPSDPNTVRWNTFLQLPLVHEVMAGNGDGAKPVWLTEFGAPTGTGEDAVSPARQARILADGFAQARRLPWVGMIFVYALRDAGHDPADREQNFGVRTAGDVPKPAWPTLVRETSRPWGRR